MTLALHKIKRTVPVVLALAIFFVGSLTPVENSRASHLKNASKAKLEEIFNRRHFEFHNIFNTIKVQPSDAPRQIPNLHKPLPKGVKGRSTMFSLMYYDGKQIVHDWHSDKVDDEFLILGQSMAKSVVSYLVGKAHCNGTIESLNDPLIKYIPELEGSYYANVKIIESLNMTAGDRKIYSKSKGGLGGDWSLYLQDLYNGNAGILDQIRNFKNIKTPKKKRFKYTNVNPDLLAIAIDRASPGGISQFASQALANPAGLMYAVEFKSDKASNPFGHAAFYATRGDWLRIAIKINEDFKSSGCIGQYLRSAVSESVSTRLDWCSRYGKYFWQKCRTTSKTIQMQGHGGQRAILDPDSGRVLVIFAIRSDYDERSVIRRFMK